MEDLRWWWWSQNMLFTVKSGGKWTRFGWQEASLFCLPPLVPCHFANLLSLVSCQWWVPSLAAQSPSLLYFALLVITRWDNDYYSSKLCPSISQLSSNIYFCSSKHNTTVLRGHCHRQIRLLCNWKSFVFERQSVDAFTSFDHARAVRHHNWSLLSFHGGVCLFCLYGTLRENNRFASHTRGEILSQPLSSLCNSLISDLLSQYSNIIDVTMC